MWAWGDSETENTTFFSQNKNPFSSLDGLCEERSCSPEQQITQWLFLSQWKSQNLGFFKLSISSPVSAVTCFGHHWLGQQGAAAHLSGWITLVFTGTKGDIKVKSQHEWSILAVCKSPSDGTGFQRNAGYILAPAGTVIESRLWVCSSFRVLAPTGTGGSGSLGAHGGGRSLCSHGMGTSALGHWDILQEGKLYSQRKEEKIIVFFINWKDDWMILEMFHPNVELSRSCSLPPAHSVCAFKLCSHQTAGKKCGWKESCGVTKYFWGNLK